MVNIYIYIYIYICSILHDPDRCETKKEEMLTGLGSEEFFPDPGKTV